MHGKPETETNEIKKIKLPGWMADRKRRGGTSKIHSVDQKRRLLKGIEKLQRKKLARWVRERRMRWELRKMMRASWERDNNTAGGKRQ